VLLPQLIHNAAGSFRGTRADKTLDPAWNTNLIEFVNPNTAYAQGSVSALALSGTTLYVGGLFNMVNGQSRSNLAAFDTTTAQLLDWQPQIDNTVTQLLVSSNTLYVGGFFNTVERQPRGKLAAYAITTRELTAWNPNMNGTITSLAASDRAIYVSGEFTAIGGKRHVGLLAVLDRTSGVASSWNPTFSNSFIPRVMALAISSDTLYISGAFTSINGQPRDGLAAFDTITGALLPWKPMVAGGVVTAFAATAASVYIGINGQSEQSPSYLLAALDTTTGGTIQWSADLPISSPVVKALWIREDQVFANIEGSYNSPFTVLVSVDANNGRLNWEAAMEPSIAALAVSNRTAYIGYRSSFPYYSERYGLKGVDAMTGVQTRSNLPTANGGIYPLAAAGDLVYVGGWFTSINNTPVSGVAIFKEILYTNHVYMPIIRH
jgi:hypothetical protein